MRGSRAETSSPRASQDYNGDADIKTLKAVKKGGGIGHVPG